MKLIIDIPSSEQILKEYHIYMDLIKDIEDRKTLSYDGFKILYNTVKNGIPLEDYDVLDKIRAEIEQIEINGHIRDVECFSAGINTALNVIDKYMEGSGE